MEEQGRPDLEDVLGRLLPDLAFALNAKAPSLLRFMQTQNIDGLSSPRPSGPTPARNRVAMVSLIQRLIEDGRPKVLDPLGEDPPIIITGLEAFNAVAAILVCTHSAAVTRVVGVCNQRDSGTGPFLAPDGKVLDDIIQLVAIGARAGERHAKSCGASRRPRLRVSAVLDLDNLLPMVAKQAAERLRRLGHQCDALG